MNKLLVIFFAFAFGFSAQATDDSKSFLFSKIVNNETTGDCKITNIVSISTMPGSKDGFIEESYLSLDFMLNNKHYISIDEILFETGNGFVVNDKNGTDLLQSAYVMLDKSIITSEQYDQVTQVVQFNPRYVFELSHDNKIKAIYTAIPNLKKRTKICGS